VAGLGREKSARRAQDRVDPRSSAFSFSSTRIRAASADVVPGRTPRSICACLAQPRSVSALIPSSAPTFRQAAVTLVPCSLTWSSTRRIARSRSSSGYFRAAPIVPLSRGLGASTKPGAIQRLLDAERISRDPAAGTAALEALTSPVISATCTRVPGMRFPGPRVQALLAPVCALAIRPAGFTSRDLRHLLAPQLGRAPEDMSGGQVSCDLCRLRAHQIIERIPHSRSYQVTPGRPVHGPVLHPADQARHHPRPRRPHRRRAAARQPSPPSRPRLQGSGRRPRRTGLTRPAATERDQEQVTGGASRNT
jgi:hypothetical protein